MRPLIGALDDGRGFVAVLPNGLECACGRLAMIVVNRDGKTRCVACDLEYKKRMEESKHETG